jgi:hypothetical protein
MKVFLIILGFVAAALILAQLGLGLMLASGPDAHLSKTHQHTGYLTVAVALVYILLSLVVIASAPKRPPA